MWDVETLTARCDDTELEPARPVLFTSIIWAPDSSAVAFDLDAPRLGVDSDIYVFAELANLTDDGVDIDEPTNGIWLQPLDGGDPVRLKLTDDIPGAIVGGVRGDALSVISATLLAESTDPVVTKFWIAGLDGSTLPVLNIDPDTGAAVPAELLAEEPADAFTLAWPRTPAGLSPGGNTGLVAYQNGDEMIFGLVDTSAGDIAMADLRVPFVPPDSTPPQWAANDVVLLPGQLGRALLLTLEPT